MKCIFWQGAWLHIWVWWTNLWCWTSSLRNSFGILSIVFVKSLLFLRRWVYLGWCFSYVLACFRFISACNIVRISSYSIADRVILNDDALDITPKKNQMNFILLLEVLIVKLAFIYRIFITSAPLSKIDSCEACNGKWGIPKLEGIPYLVGFCKNIKSIWHKLYSLLFEGFHWSHLTVRSILWISLWNVRLT